MYKNINIHIVAVPNGRYYEQNRRDFAHSTFYFALQCKIEEILPVVPSILHCSAK